MTDVAGESARRPTERLTPERVRAIRFPRTPIGRRGISEAEVGRFLHRVAEELAARDAAEASLRARAQHYKNTLVQWQREHESTDEPGDTGAAAGQPPAAAIDILSRGQQEADAYIAQTQEYCRRLAADAERHAEEIVEQARARADAIPMAREVAGTPTGGGGRGDPDDLDRRLAWARGFVTSLETVETQLRTARQALAYEFDRLDASHPYPGGEP